MMYAMMTTCKGSAAGSAGELMCCHLNFTFAGNVTVAPFTSLLCFLFTQLTYSNYKAKMTKHPAGFYKCVKIEMYDTKLKQS